MNVARPALLALLVGLAVLASPALVLQFQEPTECANDVEPVSDAAGVPASAPEFQYDELSRPAKRAFDQARSARDSITVTGDECPAEFEYGVDRSRYVVVQDESRYVLTTYQNDLVPETWIAAGVLAYLGLALVSLGVVTRDHAGARFPALIAGIGATAVVAVTAGVVLDDGLWLALAWSGVVTATTLVGAGATLQPRTAVVFGVPSALVLLPLTGVSVAFVVLAALPLVLVGVGVAARQVGASLQE